MSTKAKPETIRERIIIALDVEDRKTALSLVDRLAGRVGLFKIGQQLFTAEGPTIVREIVARGERVFLDLKFHDIPNTVAGAAASAAGLGVTIFNVHATGGSAMMRAAVEGARSGADRAGFPCPLILGVTVLTSVDAATLTSIGVGESSEDHVARLAMLAHSSGLGGVVASPLEISRIRQAIQDRSFVVLTPGIRPGASQEDDQKRIATPTQALRDGADYLVIGRPVTAAADPAGAVEEIVREASES